MKVKVPEPVNPEILYEISSKFSNLSDDELEDLLQGLETALDIICENRLKTETFSFLEYEIIFYRRKVGYAEFFCFMSGGYNLSIHRHRKSHVSDFQKQYRECFEEVRARYRESPRELNLEALIIGFKDIITQEVEAKDPYEG